MTIETFSKAVTSYRKAANLSSEFVAQRTRISVSYYEKIENGRAIPPPRGTCERLLKALGLNDEEMKHLLLLAAKERGSTDVEEILPKNVRALLRDIRLYAHKLPPTMIDYLRVTVRSVRK